MINNFKKEEKLKILKWLWGQKGWGAAIISLGGVWLAGEKNIWCWPVWIFGCILFLWHYTEKKDAPSIFLWIAYIIFNFYSWLKWLEETP